MHVRLSHHVAALAAICVLAGCSSESDVLARVGSQTIRTGDYLAVAGMIGGGYPGPPDSIKLQLLKDLVDRELLVQGALREGLHRDTVFMDFRRQIEEQLLRQGYYDQIGATSARVSDSEVEELYRWRAQESRARVVFSLSEQIARGALSQIQGGADFHLIADRFNPKDFTPPGGDIGFVTPGMLQNPIDDVIRQAPVGKLMGPIE